MNVVRERFVGDIFEGFIGVNPFPYNLGKLENDAVKRPSPHVLHQLGEALAMPYAELMRLAGYRVPGDSVTSLSAAVGAALFADLTDDERDELLEYLAWYRARRRSGRRSRD